MATTKSKPSPPRREANHTAEPWVMQDRIAPNGIASGIDIVGPDGRIVCRIPDGASTKGGHAFPRQLADANRILDCVHACAGIADPERAVPMMRKALECATQAFEERDTEAEWNAAKDCRAALAAARGE